MRLRVRQYSSSLGCNLITRALAVSRKAGTSFALSMWILSAIHCVTGAQRHANHNWHDCLDCVCKCDKTQDMVTHGYVFAELCCLNVAWLSLPPAHVAATLSLAFSPPSSSASYVYLTYDCNQLFLAFHLCLIELLPCLPLLLALICVGLLFLCLHPTSSSSFAAAFFFPLLPFFSWAGLLFSFSLTIVEGFCRIYIGFIVLPRLLNKWWYK